MKELMNSSKFWAITIGALLGSLLYYLLGDGEGLTSGFVMLLVSAYAAIGMAGKAEDIVSKYKGNG